MLKTNKAWVGQIIFGLAEHGITRVLDAVTTILLIRTLSSNEFGQFAVFQSWVSMALLALPFIETAIYREYGGWKQSGELSKMLKVFQIYNAFKIFITLLICALIAFGHSDFTERFLLMLFAFALPLSQSIYAVFRDPMKFEMKQKWVTYITSIQKLLIVVGLVLAREKFQSSIEAIVGISMVVYFLMGLIWYFQSKKYITPAKVSLSEAYVICKKLMTGTTLWIHINGVITSVVSTLDLFSLNLAKIPVEEIGRYGVATKSANFFQMIPMALINVFGVYLGKVQHEKNSQKEQKMTFEFSVAFLLLAALTLGLGAFVAEPLLSFIGKNKITPEEMQRVVQYYRWQLAGYMVMAASFPLSTYLGARSNLKKMTFQMFVPWIAISLIVYYFAALQSPLLAAKANVLVYTLMYLFFIKLYFSYKKEIAENKK